MTVAVGGDVKHKHNNLVSYKQSSATEIHHYLGLGPRKPDFVAYNKGADKLCLISAFVIQLYV